MFAVAVLLCMVAMKVIGQSRAFMMSCERSVL